MESYFYGLSSGVPIVIPNGSGLGFFSKDGNSLFVNEYQDTTYAYNGARGNQFNNTKYSSSTTVYKNNGNETGLSGLLLEESCLKFSITHTTGIKVDNISVNVSGDMTGMQVFITETLNQPTILFNVPYFSSNFSGINASIGFLDSFTRLSASAVTDGPGTIYHGDQVIVKLSGTYLGMWTYSSGDVSSLKGTVPKYCVLGSDMRFYLTNDFCNETISGINPSYYANGISWSTVRGSGTKNWSNVTPTSPLVLSNSPGTGEFNGRDNTLNFESMRHDWYLNLSVKPLTTGAKSNYAIRVPFEYYVPPHKNTIHYLNLNGATSGTFALRFGNSTAVNVNVITENSAVSIKAKYQSLYNLSSNALQVSALSGGYSIEYTNAAGNLIWGKARVSQNTATALPQISFIQRGF